MIKVSTSTTGERKVKFALSLAEAPDEVSVVGDFNGWVPGQTRMRKRSNGTRSATVSFGPAAKAVVFRYLGPDGHWFNDQTLASDGVNCVLPFPE